MAQSLGLSIADHRLYVDELLSTHAVHARCSIRRLDGTVDSDVTYDVSDGQVTVDTAAAVTRNLQVAILDPEQSISFDSRSPGPAALYVDRMLAVDLVIPVPSLADEVPCRIFTGPVTKLDRADDVVHAEAQGKELLASGPIWNPIHLKKGMKKTDAIKLILSTRAGENRFAIPDLPARLPKAINVHRMRSAWEVAREIAHSLNRQLYYDGEGVCRLRTHPNRPNFVFTGASVLTTPQISYSMDSVANTVWVKGAKPKGAKKHVSYTAHANPSHPLSAKNLGRNGVPRRIVIEIDNEHIRSEAEAKAVAERRLRRALREAMHASFDAFPIPFLDPLDFCRVTVGGLSVPFSIQQFAYSLRAGAPMTVGYDRDLKVKRRKVNQK